MNGGECNKNSGREVNILQIVRNRSIIEKAIDTKRYRETKICLFGPYTEHKYRVTPRFVHVLVVNQLKM